MDYGNDNKQKANFIYIIIGIIILTCMYFVYNKFGLQTREQKINREQYNLNTTTTNESGNQGAEDVYKLTGGLSKTTQRTTTKKDTSSRETKSKSINPIYQVGGGWLGENEFERVINRMIFVGVETGTAEFIAWKCYATAKDPKNCVNGVIGISTAESSLFKHCYQNNCFGIKPSGRIAGYNTLNEGIDDWINRYNKNWFNNHTAQDYILRSNYCVGDCSNLVNGSSNWTRAWRSNVNKMGF